jgi:hypothetical protein
MERLIQVKPPQNEACLVFGVLNHDVGLGEDEMLAAIGLPGAL